MLKEYTLKVVVQVGGESESECDNKLFSWVYDSLSTHDQEWEITHEEVVEVEDVGVVLP